MTIAPVWSPYLFGELVKGLKKKKENHNQKEVHTNGNIKRKSNRIRSKAN